uniref:Uncharacterized protein n=1 Tax=Molossus molossus TaxID=27622 RepID=A0A7J8GRD9_MOLMO|nr:hypothetical protein HJG59_011273 [Molossus molossus]
MGKSLLASFGFQDLPREKVETPLLAGPPRALQLPSRWPTPAPGTGVLGAFFVCSHAASLPPSGPGPKDTLAQGSEDAVIRWPEIPKLNPFAELGLNLPLATRYPLPRARPAHRHPFNPHSHRHLGFSPVLQAEKVRLRLHPEDSPTGQR